MMKIKRGRKKKKDKELFICKKKKRKETIVLKFRHGATKMKRHMFKIQTERSTKRKQSRTHTHSLTETWGV